MRLARSVVSVGLFFAVIAAFSVAQESPPASRPATAPTPQTHTVKRGRLALKVEATGTFLPVNPVETRIRPDAFKGELKVVSAAVHGANVKKGDVILQLDPAELNRDLDAARNDLASARANAAKAQSDVALGEQGDVLAMKMAETTARKAETDLKWWDDLIGPQMLQQTELNVRRAQAYVDDQNDEIEQLRKMYKTEDLTGATADIVVKRAVREFELSKVNLKMQQDVAKKVKDYDQPQMRLPMVFAVDQAKQALEQLKASQAHGKATRQTALKSAQLALAAAEKRVAELEKDLTLLSVAAAADGVVLYGQLGPDGVLQPADPKTLRPTEKIAAGGTVMVLFSPGSMRLGFDLPESKLPLVRQGMKAGTKPLAWPELSYEGTLAVPPPVGKAGAAEQTFGLTVELTNVDPRILPGMKATVRIDAGQGDEFPLAPVAAVVGGNVRVKGKDGKEEQRDVVVGRSDGQMIEVRKGLVEGDEVLLGAKS